MEIIFESYSAGDGGVTSKYPFGVVMSDTAQIFRSKIEYHADLEGDAQLSDMTVATRYPLGVEFTPLADGIFGTRFPLTVDFDDLEALPSASVFSTNYLATVAFTGFTTMDMEVNSTYPLSARFAPSALFQSKITNRAFFTDGLTPMNKVGLLFQQPMIYGKAHEGFTITLTQDILIGDEADVINQIYVLLQRIKIGDSVVRLTDLIKILTQHIKITDLIRYSQRLTLSDQISIHGVTLQGAIQLVTLMETLKIVAGPDWSAEITKLLALFLAIGDKVDASTFVSLSETIKLLNVQSVDITYFEKLIQSVAVALLASNSLLITAVLKDDFKIIDGTSQVAEILQVLQSAIGVTAVLSTGDESYTAWVLDAETKAAWRYDNYPFNSFAKLGDTFLGALPDGIYRIEGETDAGDDISWNVRSALLNFGTQLLKRIDVAYLGYTSDGAVGLSVYTTSPEGEKIQYNYKMVARTADVTRENRIKIGRGLESTYWAFELVGTGDFSLSDMQVLPMILTRRVQS